MALAKSLMALGMADELAKRLGYQQVSLTLSASTQNSAGGLLRGPGNKIVQITPGTNGFAVTLPSAAEIGDEIILDNITANTAVVFPQSGGTINGNAADAVINIAADGTATSKWRLVKVSATRWAAWEDGDI